MKIFVSDSGEQYVIPRRTRTDRQAERARAKRETRAELREYLTLA